MAGGAAESDESLAGRLWSEELPKLREAIRAGRPVPLGLYAGHAPGDGNDHQVVCYGHDELPDGAVRLWLYDNNHPELEVPLLATPGSNLLVESGPDGDQRWIGLFVKDGYQPVAPQYRDLVLDTDCQALNAGAFTAHARSLQADPEDDFEGSDQPFDLAPGERRPLAARSTVAWYQSLQGHWLPLRPY